MSDISSVVTLSALEAVRTLAEEGRSLSLGVVACPLDLASDDDDGDQHEAREVELEVAATHAPSINIFGGFAVTRRMLGMFQR